MCNSSRSNAWLKPKLQGPDKNEYIEYQIILMHPNKIILIEVISFVVLYVLTYTLAPKLFNPVGDAAGKGMSSGFLMLAIMAVFLLIAIVLTVVNLFLFKGVTSTGIRFLAFVPLIIAVCHGVYTFIFG